jgi:hypothetical protein
MATREEAEKFKREKEPRFTWFFQNLNELPGTDWRDGKRPKGHWLGHSRCSVSHRYRQQLGMEWVLGPKASTGISFGLSHDFENDISFSIGLWPLGTVYLHTDFVLPKRAKVKLGLLKPPRPGHKYGEFERREASIRVFGRRFWVRVWGDPDVGRSDDPWWKGFTFHYLPLDVIFGEREFDRWEKGEEKKVWIPMPEKAYAGTGQKEVHISTRRRFKRLRGFFEERTVTHKIEIPEGIPVPGRGSCAHNCGPDATYSMSSGAQTMEEAIGNYVQSCLRDRMRYAGDYFYNERPTHRDVDVGVIGSEPCQTTT